MMMMMIDEASFRPASEEGRMGGYLCSKAVEVLF